MSTYPITGIYEHYKSTPNSQKLYYVVGCARQTETDDILVIYIPLYLDPNHKGLRLQARPLAMFLEEVSWEGKQVPRFRYLGQEL